ncbi:MAG: C40 family peptidase [Candidatus Eremiobacteraeota bacterium]|nr:C40 family peptidase [Candidatus Eremiobacteraeota bacterium]
MRKRLLTALVIFLLAIVIVNATANAAVVYTVKSKDTLWKIAKNNKVSVEQILRANPTLKNEKKLKTGQSILIPDKNDDVIPLNTDSSSTSTLIVHGSGAQYQTPLERHINVMTVNGKTIKVPTFKVKRRSSKKTKTTKKPYRSKYHNLSSRYSRHSSPGGNAIVKTAFRYIGVPYVFGGSTPRAFDCSGYVQYVYRRNGVKIPRMAHHQYYAGTPISKKQMRPGDLVFFETYTKGISHVGIYIGNSNFIHASSRGAVRVDSLKKQYYTNRYRGAARY